MAKSNKPIVWGLFAGGGTVTAFMTPVLIVLTLLAALGHVPRHADLRQAARFRCALVRQALPFSA